MNFVTQCVALCASVPTVPAVPVPALLGNEGCNANCAKTYLFSFASLSARVSWHALRCDFVFFECIVDVMI